MFRDFWNKESTGCFPENLSIYFERSSVELFRRRFKNQGVDSIHQIIHVQGLSVWNRNGWHELTVGCNNLNELDPGVRPNNRGITFRGIARNLDFIVVQTVRYFIARKRVNSESKEESEG